MYTRPRPLVVGLLRQGDEIALRRDGEPFGSELDYVDADLRGRIDWRPVVRVDPGPTDGYLKVTMPGCWFLGIPGRPVIQRDVIELDPWTYVDRPSAAEPDRLPVQGRGPRPE